MNLAQFVQSFIREEDGVTAIEYGLLAALISIAIIGAVTIMGAKLSAMYTKIADVLTAAAAVVAG